MESRGGLAEAAFLAGEDDGGGIAASVSHNAHQKVVRKHRPQRRRTGQTVRRHAALLRGAKAVA